MSSVVGPGTRYRRLASAWRHWLRRGSGAEMTVAERYRDWPRIPKIENEHIVDAALHANRKSLVASLPIRRGGKVAEVGVFRGEFSAFLLEVLQPRQFFGFDTFDVHKRDFRGMPGAQLFAGLTHRQFYERALAAFGDTVVPVEGLTAQTLPGYADGSFDFVYVDASHFYDEVKADAAAAAAMVAADGFLVFDDYTLVEPEHYVPYGVVPAVNDLVVNHGWIIVGYALDEYLFCNIALRRKGAVRT